MTTASAYFDSVRIFALLEPPVYTDISNVVIDGSIKGRWGIQSSDVLERVGGVERLEFDVRNDAFCQFGEGWATPGSDNQLEGWDIGLRILIEFAFDGWKKYFTARIIPKGIVPAADPYDNNVHVIAEGWTRELANHELSPLAYRTGVSLDAVAEIILADLPVQPEATAIQTGTRIFPAAFDTLRPGDMAMGELAKAVLSEFSYAYTRRDRFVGETFVIENRDGRTYSDPEAEEVPLEESPKLLTQAGDRLLTQDNDPIYVNALIPGRFAVTEVPLLLSESSYIQTQAGDQLLTQAGDKLKANQKQIGDFDNTMMIGSPEVSDGEQILNYAKFATFPRGLLQDVDLYEISSGLLLRAGETRTFKGGYTDPTGKGATVAANTDTMGTVYAFNSDADGGGSDLLADLEAEAVYGTQEVHYTLTNNGMTDGYYTLVASGDAILINNPSEYVTTEPSSIAAYGKREAVIDMLYNVDPIYAEFEADTLLERFSSPRLIAKTFDFFANSDPLTMLEFIFLDVGDIAFYATDAVWLGGVYVINGVEFWMEPGNMLYYRHTVVEGVSAGYELPFSDWQAMLAFLTVEEREEAEAAQSFPTFAQPNHVHVTSSAFLQVAKKSEAPATVVTTAAKKAVVTYNKASLAYRQLT